LAPHRGPNRVTVLERILAMPFDSVRKQETIHDYRKHETDTGSTEVQVALLTRRINELQAHFKQHPKDHAGRRGLLKMVGQRRRLLAYIKRRDVEGYRALIKSLGLRK
jgi:small subunit ribosomal protein S15